MTSITLVHPEARIPIPIHQMITKCTLFSNAPTLTLSPSQIQSPISLSIFRDFVTALNGQTIEITTANLSGLDQLSKEFGFSEFSSKLSKFNPNSHFRLFEFRKSFQFSESASLFPAVREQLSVDSSARQFFANDRGIESLGIDSLELLLSNQLSKVLGTENLSEFTNSSIEALDSLLLKL
jgi:hypothetical protein